jgi:acyl-CoA thioester hydrolase
MTPPLLHDDEVRPAWIDHNDHMNVAFYVLVFTNALDALRARFGIGPLRLAQMHTLYGREVRLADQLRVETQVLGVAGGRLHLYQEMFHAREGYRAATFESVAEQDTPFPPDLAGRLAALIPPTPPEGAGRRVGLPAPR